MEVIFSHQTVIGGPGIGSIAYQTTLALHKAGFLKKAVCEAVMRDILKNIPENKFLTLGSSNIREYHIKDLFFDSVASLFDFKCDIFHGWGGASLHQMVSSGKAKKIIEGSSTHPNYRLKLKNLGINIHPITYKRMMAEFGLADCIFCPSEFARETYEDEKLSTMLVPYGVDLDKFKPNPVKHNNFRILFIGDNFNRKGLPELFAAWKNLDLKNAELWIRADVDIPVNNRYNVKVLERTSDTSKYYNECDVFSMPSFEEGLALVLSESMACGIPVITTKQSGWFGQDGKHGFLIKPDPDDIARAIQYYYDNPDEAKKHGRAGRLLAEKYSWENYAQTLISSYSKLM